jgi:dolichol-phosphate mannosyltransferase
MNHHPSSHEHQLSASLHQLSASLLMPPPDLLIVMPSFNEESCIRAVVSGWHSEAERVVGNFTMLVIDDGSSDSTPRILCELQAAMGPRLEILSRENRGHGQTCLQGYRIALERGIPYILQVDSDGQSDPRHFVELWDRREDFDVIYGKRMRSDGFRRVAASLVLRHLLKWIAAADCIDANVPYRLMNTAACAEGVRRVPEDMFLANVGLAVILAKSPAIRHGEVAIGFPPRQGGEPSVPFGKFAAKGLELFLQMKKAGIY